MHTPTLFSFQFFFGSCNSAERALVGEVEKRVSIPRVGEVEKEFQFQGSLLL